MGWKEAYGGDSGFNEAPTLLDLREVSQSFVAKRTAGLWDCFVLGPEPKMAQILKPHWLVQCSDAGKRRQAELIVPYVALPRKKKYRH